MMQGSIGPWELAFLDIPRGRTGRARVKVRPKSGGDWKELTVGWELDSQGIRLELPEGMRSYDVRAGVNDDGATQYQLVGRGMNGEWLGLRFVRKGEEANGAGAGGARKGWKLKSQMPGKIVKVLVAVGDEVQKGQPMLVMEAMKMENEIKATGSGKVVQLNVTPGKAIETGALLVVVE
jgi:acetyl/propionyl-CoA carboxylase alpha subunit